MKFSLVGSFNLADGYLGAAKALRSLGHVVEFIPAQLYLNEYRHRHCLHVLRDLQSQSPDVVLWWRAETMTAGQLNWIKTQIKSAKHVMYSWDDPFQWESHLEMPDKCKVLDHAFTCCESSVKDYENNGCPATYCPPGFDPEVHFPEDDENYKCDISLVCTNLYHGNLITQYAHVSRKDLMDTIIESFPDANIKIYGPEGFKKIYPKHYAGWLGFNESRKVFYNSKINLCTHIRPDGYKYINERVTQILGSGGLLLVDNVSGIRDMFSNAECLVMDSLRKEDITNQVKNIIENYAQYEDVKKRGYEKAKRELTWNNWAEKVINNIGQEQEK